MSYATIEVKPVTPLLGAEIFGIDLTGTLSNQQVDDLHTALAQHQVLFFRDQPFTLDSQKAFGRLFGELHIHPNIAGPDGHPEPPGRLQHADPRFRLEQLDQPPVQRVDHGLPFPVDNLCIPSSGTAW